MTTVYTESSSSRAQHPFEDPGAEGVVVGGNETLLELEPELELSFVVIGEFEGYDDRDDIISLAELHERGRAPPDAPGHHNPYVRSGPGGGMNGPVVALLALLTGFLAGAVFAFVGVPIPAPPQLAGLLGIVGIYLGFRTIEYLGVGFDLLESLGI